MTIASFKKHAGQAADARHRIKHWFFGFMVLALGVLTTVVCSL
jgi:hypothetical protein